MSPGSDFAPPIDMGTGFVFGKNSFYFVRHGETYETHNGIVQGQMDSHLSEAGRQSAQALARNLNGREIGSIYSSPLERAWRTAAIIAERTGAPMHALPGLKERYWGHYQGRPKDERPGIRDPEGTETLDAFSSRVMEAMWTIRGPGPVLVVAHSGVFRVLLQQINKQISATSEVANSRLILIEPPKNDHAQWRVTDALL